jgi:putative ABC transport system permease protein
MHLADSIKMAVATLTTNKLRTALTMLGITIGNASIVMMMSVGQGAQRFTQEKLESYGANLLEVFVGNEDAEGATIAETMPFVLSDVEAIANAPSVRAVSPMIQSNFPLSYRNRNTKTTVIGVTPTFPQVRNTAVANGNFFNLSDQQQTSQVIALGPELAKTLFENENPIGKEVRVGTVSFQVIALMRAKGAFLGDNPDTAAYVPITTMAEQLIGRRSSQGIPVDSIQMSAKDKDSLRAAAFQVTNILTQLRGKKDFSIVANKSFQELLGQVTGALGLMLAAIASISLLVGGVGIMNIMLVSVTERTQEIGLRKAVGSTQRDIMIQFLIEAIILSTTGGVIGIGFGVGGAIMIGFVVPFKPVIPVAVILISLSISSSIGLVFGVIPARQAAQLDPIVALRST